MQKNKLNLHIYGIHLLNRYKTVVSHLNLRGMKYHSRRKLRTKKVQLHGFVFNELEFRWQTLSDDKMLRHMTKVF